MAIDALLKSYERFGVHLGLEEIQQLLTDLGNPQQRVPVIHVAGTNGKGSVCAYLSAVLTQAGYRVGRYTSPHLVDWCERIQLNEQAIAPLELERSLLQVQSAIQPGAAPTQFEVITAAAWLYFAQQQVDVAVVEVGLGGRLDATNVCDRPLVSIITSISWEHWQRLGPTLADIAREKAGILKPGCPVVVGPLPAEARAVVEQRIAELACPAVWPEPAIDLGGWAGSQGIRYPLPLLGAVQLTNSALAIATLQVLRQGWEISEAAIALGMAKTTWPGRLQWAMWSSKDQTRPLLIDGAHNRAAAQALQEFVQRAVNLDKPITWVIGMLSTKDHAGILSALLRPGDRVYGVPVPGHDSLNPEKLVKLAREICPDLGDCFACADLVTGLEATTQITAETGLKPTTASTVILCGSLYLVGDFLKYHQARP